MTRRFEAYFSSTTNLSPCFVYISPCETDSNEFSVGILYQASSAGTFESDTGILKNFDFKQETTKSEKDALNWATSWLTQKSGCTASLNEVTV